MCPCACGKAGGLARALKTASIWLGMTQRHCLGIGGAGGREVGVRASRCVVVLRRAAGLFMVVFRECWALPIWHLRDFII